MERIHTYRPYDAAREVDDVARLMSLAFGGSLDDCRAWIGGCAEHVRVLEEEGHVRGTLALYPMGHWFGGRAVPARGVAGVAVDPGDRGRGVGTRLMLDAVREIHDEGVALSALYPAVLPLYRRAGYELAGVTHATDLLLRRIAPVDRALPLRRGTPDDEPLLEHLEAAQARLHDGNVVRGPLMWQRARTPGGKPTEVHVVLEDGAVTGFLRLRHVHDEGERWLSVPDVVTATPAAARRLLAFLSDHGSTIEKARLRIAPSHALLAEADSPCVETRIGLWMLRITHLESALAARGYPPGLSADVHMDVEDALCPANAGRWRLRVEDGAAAVERGGEGRVRLHVRDLAPIYSGFAHPLVTRRAGRVEGSEADLRVLGAVFAGGAPWMQDGF